MLDFSYPSVSFPIGTGLALDLGCGSGRHRRVIEDSGYRWVGVDIDTSRGDARLLEADACALPFETGVFSLVWMSCVLEHVGNPWQAMAEIRRVTAPGGLVMGISGYLDPDATHICGLTQLGLQRVLADVGLSQLKITPATLAFPVILRKYLMYMFGNPEFCTPVAFALSRVAVTAFQGTYRLFGAARVLASRRSLREYGRRLERRNIEVSRDFAAYLAFAARND